MKNQKGYIAIASVLVIAAVVTLIGVTVSLTSINEAQVSFSNIQGDVALDLVEGCVEDALLYLSKRNALPSTVSIPAGTCTVTTESHVGNDWTFTVEGVFSNYSKRFRIQANRGSTVSITSWQEIE